MTTHAKKIVLLAESGDILDRDRLLRELFDDRIELFCAVGKDAGEWEEALAWIAVEASVNDGVDHFVARSIHRDEAVEDVIEFAKQIAVPSNEEEIEIIRV